MNSEIFFYELDSDTQFAEIESCHQYGKVKVRQVLDIVIGDSAVSWFPLSFHLLLSKCLVTQSPFQSLPRLC